MRTRRRIRCEDERGVAAVEFALIAPVLFMLIFGIISFGLAWSQKNVFVGAAREGARYAAVMCQPNTSGSTICTTDLVKARITDAAVGYPVDLNNGSFSVTVGDPPTSGVDCTTASGQPVTVSWTQPIQLDVPFIPINLNVPIEAVFRCE